MNRITRNILALLQSQPFQILYLRFFSEMVIKWWSNYFPPSLSTSHCEQGRALISLSKCALFAHSSQNLWRMSNNKAHTGHIPALYTYCSFLDNPVLFTHITLVYLIFYILIWGMSHYEVLGLRDFPNGSRPGSLLSAFWS